MFIFCCKGNKKWNIAIIFIVFQGNEIRILKYFYIFAATNIYFISNGTTMWHRRTSKRG